MIRQFEFNAIDRHFAGFICRKAENASPWLELAASLVSNAIGEGNICFHLAGIAGQVIQVSQKEVPVPGFADLRGYLESTTAVGSPGAFRPLVLDSEGRLYLYRYWKYEQDLARVVLGKARGVCAVDESLLAEGLRRLFPPCEDGFDWQKVAAAAATRKRFCVISGGPGTGKTSTVVKILSLLIEQPEGKSLRIALAAPTGKSAARLKEAIRGMKEELNCAAEVKDCIPEDVSTIHRLLGVTGTSIRFRHSEENLLPHDVVIVDEASMVSLPLITKLAVSLKPETRLILLGDRDQLASVEAGAVLGDICGAGRQERFSREFDDFVARLTGRRIPAGSSAGACPPLGDSLVVLKKNYRFKSDSGIGAAAAAVNRGDYQEAVALLKGGGRGEISWREISRPDGLKSDLAEVVIDGYAAFLGAKTPAEALKCFDDFRILCALRQGPYGSVAVNAAIEEVLARKGLINPCGRWYQGRPILVTVNDYNLRLFNGDVGIVFEDADAGGKPRVFFADAGGAVRSISPVRLPEHETVFAMTIHKSQGSEFDRVLMLLPGRDSDLLTRELVYTGLTRARKEVRIWADETVFGGSVRKRIERSSGLAAALWPRP